MAALSGTSGFVQLGSCTMLALVSWDGEFGNTTEQYFAASGQGAAETVKNAWRGSGNLNLVIDPLYLAGAINQSGDLVSVVLGSSSTETMTGQVRLGQFRISSVDLQGGPQLMTIPFETHGFLTGTLLGT